MLLFFALKAAHQCVLQSSMRWQIHWIVCKITQQGDQRSIIISPEIMYMPVYILKLKF